MYKYQLTILTMLLLVLFSTQSLADCIAEGFSGVASVVDGDTIEIQGQRIRLYGIDAPEIAQVCTPSYGKPIRCGQKASLKLSDFIGQANVTCCGVDTDRYKRVIAICHKGKVDINAWMVEQGWAVAYKRYSTDYVPNESRARAAKLNIWGWGLEMPWDWRKKLRDGKKKQ